METMQGNCHIFKGGVMISAYLTMRYESTNKRTPHVQGAITKRIKQEIKKLGADYADVYIHYSVLPSGPFCTRGIGRVTP